MRRRVRTRRRRRSVVVVGPIQQIKSRVVAEFNPLVELYSRGHDDVTYRGRIEGDDIDCEEIC